MSKNVVLLFGGNSEERMVSVASAQNLSGQFQFSQLIYQDTAENLYKVDAEELHAHQNAFTQEFKPKAAAFAKNIPEAVPYFKDKIVFMGYHGSQGENGEVQSLFEKNNICFTGSGSEASHTAFDKNIAKEVISNTSNQLAEGIKFEVKKIDSLESKIEGFFLKHKKIVFKPTSSGSSFGLHIVSTVDELMKACAEIKKSGFAEYLMENFIKGRELTIGVLQMGDDLVALPASEAIIDSGRSFDYNGKYLGSGTKEITPALVTDEELQSLQQVAVEAHLAFGCYGYSRTDIILSESGPYFIETNTLPGLTKASFIPQQLLAADIPIKNFIAEQIRLAEIRYEVN